MGASLSIAITQGTQDIVNNRTYVTVTAKVAATGSTYNAYNSGSEAPTGSLSGTFSGSWTKGFAKGATTTLYTKSAWVSHDSQGKCTVSFKASYNTKVSPGTISASASKALTTIPRVSDISLDKTSVLADNAAEVVATVVKKASGFTDTVVVKLGGYSQTITSGTPFTIPKDWNNAISGTSAVATVTVTTKSDGTTIGSKSVNLTVNVPTSIVPTISSIATSEAVSAVTSAFGNRFVKTLSQINVVVNATGAYGSTIKSYQTTLDGVTYVASSFTSNALNTAGTLKITTKVTDSRGRTKTLTKNVTVVDYTPPTITSMSYITCNADGTENSSGTCTKVIIAGEVSSVDSQNTKALSLKYKAQTASSYTVRALTLSAWTFEVSTIVSGTDPTVTYEFVAELTDKISPTTKAIATAITAMSFLAGGKGVTVLGEAEKEGFWVQKIRYDITEAEFTELLNLLGGGSS